MYIFEASKLLDGSQYREEGNPQLFRQMKNAKLVAVFGASDDLMEFRGAIDDEVGCFGGGTAYITKNGLLSNQCENDDCPYFHATKKDADTITAIWSPKTPNCSWIYRTTIPHTTFNVYEDQDLYCVGIVFSLDNVMER